MMLVQDAVLEEGAPGSEDSAGCSDSKSVPGVDKPLLVLDLGLRE